jgi:site-specific DNA-methyltransferase (adenine-specific)
MKPFYSDKLITIYQGDSRAVMPFVPQVDFIFTDPSYGHNNNNGDLIHNLEAALGKGKPGRARKICNDDPLRANELAKWLFEIAAQKLRCCCCCCCCCCCGGGGPDPQFARWSLWMDQHLNFKQMVVWDKGPMGLGWHYRRSYETVLVAQKGKGKCKWYDGSHRIENILRPGAHGIRKIIPSKRQHPTQKPEALAEFFIKLHSKRGDLVLDPFMGSGTTLAAAKKLGRRAIGIDLEKRWCRMAAKRLEAIP